LVRSRKVDPCKIKTSNLGLEISVKQDVDRVDVVVHDGVVAFVVEVAEPFSNAYGDGPPRRPVQRGALPIILVQ
jgi:hypothetical protein